MTEEMIGKQIKKLRTRNGWSQPQLADKMDVSRQTISNWENGTKSPRMGALQKLSDLFHVTIGYITDGDDNESDSDQKDLAKMIKNDDYMTFGGRPLTEEEKKLLTKLLRDD